MELNFNWYISKSRRFCPGVINFRSPFAFSHLAWSVSSGQRNGFCPFPVFSLHVLILFMRHLTWYWCDFLNVIPFHVHLYLELTAALSFEAITASSSCSYLMCCLFFWQSFSRKKVVILTSYRTIPSINLPPYGMLSTNGAYSAKVFVLSAEKLIVFLFCPHQRLSCTNLVSTVVL